MNEAEHNLFRQLINQASGRPLDPEDAQRLNNHLAECASCRSKADEMVRLDAALRRTFHTRWDGVAEPNRSRRTGQNLSMGQARGYAHGIAFELTWQTASKVVGMVVLVILLTVGAVLASKALPARQPLPGLAAATLSHPPEPIPTQTLTPSLKSYLVQAGDTLQSIANRFGLSSEELMAFNGMKSAAELWVGRVLQLEAGSGIEARKTPVPTGESSTGIAHLSESACAQAEPLADLLAFKDISAKALSGSGQVQSGDFKIGLWLACDSSFIPMADDRSKVSELAGLGIYYAWSYSGADQAGMTALYAGFEPSFRQVSGIGPSLSSSTSQSGSRGFTFPAESAPDWSQARVALRFIVKVQAPDNSLHGAELRFDLVNSAEGYTVQNLAVLALPAEALSDVNAGIAQKPAYATRALDPLLEEIVGLTQKWSQKIGTQAGWVHLLTERETPFAGTLSDGSPAPVWTQWDDWYLIDANGHRINAINRILDRSGLETQVSVLRNGFWDNLTNHSHDPDDPTVTIRWGAEAITNVSEWLRMGAKLTKLSLQNPNGQDQVIFRLSSHDTRDNFTFDPQSGQLLEWTSERLTDGTLENGVYKIERRETYLRQERVAAPPEAILALLGQAPKPLQTATPQGKPTPFGFDPALSILSMNMVMGNDLNSPNFFWYGDLAADGTQLGRVNFGATPGGWCDRSPDGKRIAFSFEVQNSATSITSSLRWLELKDVTRVYDPIPQYHLLTHVTWGPNNRSLAFSGGTNDQDNALNVFDIQTGELRRVGRAGFGPLLWSPDGQLLAQLEEQTRGAIELAIYRVADGTEIYRGKWDSNLWLPADDAPMLTWGVKMPKTISGFDRCVQP